jgi:hypothetical protein
MYKKVGDGAPRASRARLRHERGECDCERSATRESQTARPLSPPRLLRVLSRHFGLSLSQQSRPRPLHAPHMAIIPPAAQRSQAPAACAPPTTRRLGTLAQGRVRRPKPSRRTECGMWASGGRSSQHPGPPLQAQPSMIAAPRPTPAPSRGPHPPCPTRHPPASHAHPRTQAHPPRHTKSAASHLDPLAATRLYEPGLVTTSRNGRSQ